MLDVNHCPATFAFPLLSCSPRRDIPVRGCLWHRAPHRQLQPHAGLPLPPPHPPCRIDYLFLDCTFDRCPYRSPPSTTPSVRSRSSSSRLITYIWKHPNKSVVYLVCDMLGHEDVLVEVYRAFSFKIHVDTASECHHTLTLIVPEIFADGGDSAASRFRVIPFPRLPERAAEILSLVQAKRQLEPLIIRPSSQWYTFYDTPEASMKRSLSLMEAVRDEVGVWHVCFLVHSPWEELEHALAVLQPKWVMSTKPPCMVMDLSYVRKHCSLSRLSPDDPLWKLFGILDGTPTVDATGSSQAAVTVEAIKKKEEELTCSVEQSGSDVGSKVEVAEPTLEELEIRVEQPLTLFGLEARNSDKETVSYNNSKPVEIIDVNEAAAKELNSVTESELWKDDEVEVVNLTEDERKEQSMSAESELCMDANCEDGIKKGNWEA
ncbi:hypothetical protein ACP70R_009365 [Stipagrostis hirtigluma subsp. patula]